MCSPRGTKTTKTRTAARRQTSGITPPKGRIPLTLSLLLG